MKLSGSANAKSIEEYLRADILRFIFKAALPSVRGSSFKTRTSTRARGGDLSQDSRNQIFKLKIDKLEKLADLIEEEKQLLSIKWGINPIYMIHNANI